MIGVFTDLPAFRGAVGELPLSLVGVAAEAAAIVVVAGVPGWVERARRAAARGAAAVVVDAPRAASPAELATLDALPCPVVFSRARLRADVVPRAARAEPPALLVASCAATAAEIADVTRDAIGWVRVVGGGPVSVLSSAGDADAALAHIESAGIAGTLVVTVLDAPARSRIRVTALGVERTVVEVVGGDALVQTASVSGVTVAPPSFEDPARVALRRAVAAVAEAADHVPDRTRGARDVEAFRADAAAAADALAGLSAVLDSHKRDRSRT